MRSERLDDEIELPPPDPSRWQEQLKDMLCQVRTAAHRHRDSARISLGKLPSVPMLAGFSEWLFPVATH